MLVIRKAHLNDENVVMQHMKVLFSSGSSGESMHNWAAMSRQFRKTIASESSGAVFLAEEEGQALGMVTLAYIEAIRCGGIYGSIEEFVVLAEARGKGVGGKLLEAAIQEAREKHCAELVVNRPSQLGLPVYLRYGIKEAGKALKLDLPHDNL